MLRKVLSRATSICATVGVGSDPMIKHGVTASRARPGRRWPCHRPTARQTLDREQLGARQRPGRLTFSDSVTSCGARTHTHTHTHVPASCDEVT